MADFTKPSSTRAFPTLVGRNPGEASHDDATAVQTRGPWTLDEAPPGTEAGGPIDESELPALPGPVSPAPLERLEDQLIARAATDEVAPVIPPAPAPAVLARPSSEPEPAVTLPPPPGTAPSPAQAWVSGLSTDLDVPSALVGGRYAIEARIGEGGMGKVYRVKHRELDKTFALKIMRSVLAADETARKGFFREARLASSMSHPSIVSVVAVSLKNSFGAYMVMELLDGEPLKTTLKEKGRVPLRQACDIMLQIADAIRYIHEKGVVHCDLKTENVLVSAERTDGGRRKSTVKLLDFGLARSHRNPNESMAIAGTPAYIAPERIRGAPPAPAMDLYGLGIIFYEMLTGAPPFTGTIEAVLYNHINEPPVPPSAVIGQLDESIEAIILKALAKAPDDRQKSVGAFIYELRTAMEMLGMTTRRRARSKTSPPRGAGDLVSGLFAECPLPLAVFASDGTILIGNKAFSTFVSGQVVDLRGVRLGDTALVRAAPGMLDEVRAVAAHGRPGRVSMQTRGDAGEALEVIAWLTPAAEGPQVYCAIHIAGTAG